MATRVEARFTPETSVATVAGIAAEGWKTAGVVAALGLACLLPFTMTDFRLFQFTQVFIYAIALMGLNVLTGYSGQISLGHGAFYGIGAYVAAIMLDRWSVPWPLTIPAAGLVCLVAGFLFGRPALRLEGLYLALATFALALAVPQILKYFEHWTGGSQGLVLMKPAAPFGLPLSEDQWLYFVTLFVTAVALLLARNIMLGRPGRATLAIRDNPLAAQSMGVNTALYKSLAFGVSAAYTGVAGALSALAVGFVAPDSFTVFLSISLLTGIVVGGLATISGAVYGALFIQFVPNLAQDISKAAPWAIFGVFLILCMYVMPHGIAGALRLVWARLVTISPKRSDTMKRSMFVLTLVAFGLMLIGGPAGAETPGVTATEIKVGNIAPYSGPASAYGTIGKAIGAWFKKVNDEGGINGRKIAYVSADDGYSPPKALEMARKLVEHDQVLFIVNPLGTPSNSAIQKYMNQKKTPQLFVASGATKWGDPQNFPWTMGWNVSYQAEARIYAMYIMKNIPDAKVGVLYQNDDFGKDYLKGLVDTFGANAKKIIVAQQTYEVSDPLVDSQIVNLKNSDANVLVNVSTPKAAVQSIKKAYEIGWKPVHFVNVNSASVGAVLKVAGVEASKGVMTATPYKDPFDPQWKNDAGVKEYVEFMKKYMPDAKVEDGNNFYGLMVAQTAVQVLKQCGNDLSRENVMKQAANLKNLSLGMLIAGITINTSPTDYFPLEQMQLAKFDGERWVMFGEVLDAGKR
jgi:branched-chain amino acid transport system substrate-binding protein